MVCHFVAERSASALSGPPGDGVASLRSYLRPRGTTTRHTSQGTTHFRFHGVVSLFNASIHAPTTHKRRAGPVISSQRRALHFAATGLHTGASITPIRQSRFDSSTRLGGPKGACLHQRVRTWFLTTGWYDCKVRVHDLRLAASSAVVLTTTSYPLRTDTGS